MIWLNKTSEIAVKRLGVYFFYDAEGIVDEYVLFALQEFKVHLDTLAVICPGKLSNEGRRSIAAIADEVLLAQQDIDQEQTASECLPICSWQSLCNFDEVVLLDDSMFGPVYPLKDMFNEMGKRDADFWGIAMHYGFLREQAQSGQFVYVPDQVSASFLVLRRNLVASDCFRTYWKNLEITCRSAKPAFEQLLSFTDHFVSLGYNYDVFVNTEDLRNNGGDPLMLYPLELVMNRKCPLFKRECFLDPYDELFQTSCGESTVLLYEFLRGNTQYDVDLIWKYVLRKGNLADIKERMHLNYVLPATGLVTNGEAVGKAHRIALVMHLICEDYLDVSLRYVASMPLQSDIYITTDTNSKRQQIENRLLKVGCKSVHVLQAGNRGRHVGALLVSLKRVVDHYDYICVVNDKNVAETLPRFIGQSAAYKSFENVLCSRDYVYNVLATFEANPRLGMLFPPPPHHSRYMDTIGHEWKQSFSNTLRLAQLLNIQVDMEEKKLPVAPADGVFWARPLALKKLFAHEWQYGDFPVEPAGVIADTIMDAIVRLYSFVAQDAGYYSGWLLSQDFVTMELTNSNFLSHVMQAQLAEKRKLLKTRETQVLALQTQVEAQGNHVEVLHQGWVERDALIASLQRSLGEKSDHIEVLHRGNIDRDAQIGAQQQTLNEREAHIRVLLQAVDQYNQQLADLASRVSEQHAELSKQRAELAGIYNSRSWKITKPLRWLSRAVGKN